MQLSAVCRWRLEQQMADVVRRHGLDVKATGGDLQVEDGASYSRWLSEVGSWQVEETVFEVEACLLTEAACTCVVLKSLIFTGWI